MNLIRQNISTRTIKRFKKRLNNREYKAIQYKSKKETYNNNNFIIKIEFQIIVKYYSKTLKNKIQIELN